MRKLLLKIAQIIVLLQLPALVLSALLIGLFRKISKSEDRVVFGGAGLINLSNWCQALKQNGFCASTKVWGTPTIYPPTTFDFDLQAKYKRASYIVAPFSFVQAIRKYNVVVCGFDGFLLGTTFLRKLEPSLLHLANCKIIAIPYGGDAYFYSNMKNESLQHAIQLSYPYVHKHQIRAKMNVRRMVEKADFLMSGFMNFDGIGRWDLLAPSSLVINTDIWQSSKPKHASGKMKVLHTPNHRGFKGTEFIVRAVDELRKEGLQIELLLVEKQSNTYVRQLLTTEIDVLIEQLIFPGYAMSAIEGMSCGAVVISNLKDERIMQPMKRWSFLSECPIVSADPETIKEVLRDLYHDIGMRRKISLDSRIYALKYHSFKSFAVLFEQILKYLNNERDDLLNYYHPIIGEYSPQATAKSQNQKSLINE